MCMDVGHMKTQRYNNNNGLLITIKNVKFTKAEYSSIDSVLENTILWKQHNILNLKAVKIIDAWGLNRIIRYYKATVKVRGTLQIIDVQPRVYALMLQIKLDSLFDIVPEEPVLDEQAHD